MSFAKIISIAGLLVLSGVLAASGGVKVVANSGVPATSVSADELKGVFLGSTTSLSDGTRVQPVLEKGGPAHVEFLKLYLGKSESALEAYYRGLVFTGKGSMPKTLGSDAEVVAFVAKTKGAIGYVSSSANTEGVKTLAVK